MGGRHGEWMEAAVSERLILRSRDAATQNGEARNRLHRETKHEIHEQIKYRFNVSVLVKGNVAFMARAQCQDAWAVASAGQMSATLLT